MDAQVDELLLRWRESRDQGRPLALDELCPGPPELRAQLERSIRSVTAMEGWLGMGTAPAAKGSAATLAYPASALTEPKLPPAPTGLDVPGYDILGVLNQGGMGIVYKARQPRLKRLVALKMIRTDLHVGQRQLGRFRVEVEAVAKLQHPHIVQIYEVGEAAGQPYYSMELVDGGSLAQQSERLPPTVAAALVATIARAIHFAHERGVVHRDLKPANILLAGSVPKVADFGLAKLLDTESGLSRPGQPTQSGMVLGTPSYMAPEQAEGRTKDVGPSVDVYALGAILYELLTGKPPFVGATPLDTMLRVVSSPPVAPSREQPQVPRDLETICLKCLEKRPGQRYASAAALADDLQRFIDGHPIVARPISLPRRVGMWARRRPELAVLLGALLLSVLGLGAVLGTRYHEHQEARRAATRLAPRARDILVRYCYDCHGHDPRHLDGDLVVLDYAMLRDPARELVVPGDIPGSRLIHRIEDGSMPPEEQEEFPRLSSDELEDLKKWVAGGAPPFAVVAPPPAPPVNAAVAARAAAVKEIFREKCHECHRFGQAKNGIKILNYDLLVAKRKVVVPGKPEQSSLFQALLSKDKKKAMPPPEYPPLTEAEVETIRQWIAEGAVAFPRALLAKP